VALVAKLVDARSWMFRTRLICAIGVSLASAVMSASQAAPAVISESLRAHMKNDRFDAVTAARGLPLGVREALQAMFGSAGFDIALDIADPGVKFAVTGAASTPPLAIRRLIAAECSIDHCLVHYERGGSTPTFHVALFHWTRDATRLEYGGLAPKRLATIADVRTAVLSGSLKSPSKIW
jgi:hypothetical protein